MTEPLERAKAANGIDEVGVYRHPEIEGWVQLIYFDHQGQGVMEFPEELLGPLGEALRRARTDRPDDLTAYWTPQSGRLAIEDADAEEIARFEDVRAMVTYGPHVEATGRIVDKPDGD